MEVLTPAEVYIAATDEGEMPEIAAASLEASGVEKSRRNRKVASAACVKCLSSHVCINNIGLEHAHNVSSCCP